MPRSSTPAVLHRGRLFISACAGLFVFGVVLVILGTLFGMPEMRARLGVSDLIRQGNLQTMLLFGVFLATVAAGPLIDRFGNQIVLAASAALAALALAGFAFLRGYTMANFFGFALGIGGGGLNMATNVLVSQAFEEDRGAKLNLLAVFFGVGALFFPAAAALVGPRYMSAVILAGAVVAAACTASYLALPFPAAQEASGFSLREASNVVRYPALLLFAFLLFFESGNEAALIGWTSTWARSMPVDTRTATLVLALFQAMMMLGRIGASRLVRVISEERLVLGSAVGALASALIIVSAPSVTMLALGIALAGLTFASIYPTMLAMAGDRYRSFAGTVFGLLFAVGLIGGMLFPWAIGHLSQSSGIRAGMAAPVFGATMICVLFLLIRSKQPQASDKAID